MKHALKLAKKGIYSVAPNPMVGCVIVKDNRVIGEGWHVKSGHNHAEINAIEDVRKSTVLLLKSCFEAVKSS